MSRFTMVLAAAIATATLVTAATALDAVGADAPPKKGPAADDLIGRLADCLRDRGAAVPALDGAALEHWLQASRLADADVRACKVAVQPRIERHEAPAQSVEALSRCLRTQGLDVPTDPVALKDWIGRQRGRTALRAMEECGLVSGPDARTDRKPAPCGEARGQGARRPADEAASASAATRAAVAGGSGGSPYVAA